MPRQLQYPKNSHDAEHLNDSADVEELFGGAIRQAERHEIRYDGEKVDEVHHSLHELTPAQVTQDFYTYTTVAEVDREEPEVTNNIVNPVKK